MEANKSNEEQKPVENTTNEKDTKQDFILCPCCGKPTLTRPVKINDALLDHYMACIISGVPFSHTYPIYGGRIKVTVSQLDEPMLQRVREAYRTLTAWKDLVTDAADTFEDLANLINLYSGITEIVVKAGDTTKELQPYKVVTDICDKLITTNTEDTKALVALAKEALIEMRSPKTAAGLPAAIIIGIIEAHHQIYNILLGAGFDVNFWEGIELA